MIPPLPFSLALLAGVLLCVEIGRRLGRRHVARDPEGAQLGTGALDAGVYGLLGLLLAFTFSGAATRFDARRELTGKEANAIGTAYLRLDMLPADTQGPLREKFRAYVDSRIATYGKLPDIAAAYAEFARSRQLQDQIWGEAVAATRRSDALTSLLVLPPINEMIDISTTQLVAAETHPPAVIFVMLGAMALVSSLLAGYGLAAAKKTRHVLHVVVFAGVLACSAYVILDLEYPRLGLIRVETADQTLVDLRSSMH